MADYLRELAGGQRDSDGRWIITGRRYSLDVSHQEVEHFNFSDRAHPSEFLDSMTATEATFRDCQFIGATIHGGKYIGCVFVHCDFRFARFEGTYLPDSRFVDCDLFAAQFDPTVDLRGAHLIDASLSNGVFNGVLMTPDALLTRRGGSGKPRPGIMQDSKAGLRRFHAEWRSLRTDEVARDPKYPDEPYVRGTLVPKHNREAETVYRSLSGMWATRGELGNATWAYVRAKQAHRRSLFPFRQKPEDEELGPIRRARDGVTWLGSLVADVLCAYGTNVMRLVVALALLIGSCALGYRWLDQLQVTGGTGHATGWGSCLLFSLGSLVTNRPTTLTVLGRATDVLSAVETMLGVLLVGLIGFVLANKLRQS